MWVWSLSRRGTITCTRKKRNSTLQKTLFLNKKRICIDNLICLWPQDPPQRVVCFLPHREANHRDASVTLAAVSGQVLAISPQFVSQESNIKAFILPYVTQLLNITECVPVWGWGTFKKTLYINKDMQLIKKRRDVQMNPKIGKLFFFKEIILFVRTVKKIFFFYICHIKDYNKNVSASTRLLRCVDSTFIKH